MTKLNLIFTIKFVRVFKLIFSKPFPEIQTTVIYLYSVHHRMQGHILRLVSLSDFVIVWTSPSTYTPGWYSLLLTWAAWCLLLLPGAACDCTEQPQSPSSTRGNGTIKRCSQQILRGSWWRNMANCFTANLFLNLF